MVSGGLLLAAVGLFLLRYVPDTVDFFPNRGDLSRAFVPVASMVMLVLLAFGLGAGWLLAGRMLAPLDRIGDAARLAAQGSLSHRVSLAGPRDEFRDLADVFDSMLEQLEAHVAEQQRFAANASHELRTPLAISQTLLEVAEADPDRDVDALIARLREVNTRSIAPGVHLTRAARSGIDSRSDRLGDLSLLAEGAVEALLPLADRRGVAVEVGGAPAPVLGSAALLPQLVTNLVLNAIVHNLPSGGAVAVRTHSMPQAVALVVENTGEVLPAPLVATLVEPFQRGAERTRGDDHAGAGLGLAIVDRITRRTEAPWCSPRARTAV